MKNPPDKLEENCWKTELVMLERNRSRTRRTAELEEWRKKRARGQGTLKAVRMANRTVKELDLQIPES